MHPSAMSALGQWQTSLCASCVSAKCQKQPFAFSLGEARQTLSTRPWHYYLDGCFKKTLNKAGEGVPVGELAIARDACSTTVLCNDKFDDLLLEVVVFSEV